MRDLNIVLWQTIVDHWEGGHYTDDYSSFIREYLAHAEEILQQEDEDREDDYGPNEKIAPPPSQLLSTPSFSFGATSSAPRVDGPSNSASSLSFGTTPSALPVTGPSSSAPSFSFGATSTAPSTSHSNTASNCNEEEEDDDDPTANPDDGQVELVEGRINLEEDTLYEVRARSSKKAGNAWKQLATGTLRVYRHKVTGKHRMVIRNEIGKELFNVAVGKGMKFDKMEKNTKGKVTHLKFFALQDVEKGGELFLLQVKPEYVDELHRLLESLAKG